jgi:hypothetical protein
VDIGKTMKEKEKESYIIKTEISTKENGRKAKEKALEILTLKTSHLLKEYLKTMRLKLEDTVINYKIFLRLRKALQTHPLMENSLMGNLMEKEELPFQMVMNTQDSFKEEGCQDLDL